MQQRYIISTRARWVSSMQPVFFPFFSSLIPFYLQRQRCSKHLSILTATQAVPEEGSHYLTACYVSACQPIS